MGRLTKKKIDQIRALLREGFTQGETAKKLHVGRGTVSKYAEEEPEGGEVPPPDSELEDLERKKKRLEAWMELETVKQAMMKVPQRLDELQATVEVLGADQDLLREWFKSLPISNLGRKWECSQCGDEKYVTVKVKCSRCGYETEWGRQCPEQKKIHPALVVS